VAHDDDQLRDKARLLLQRERELFELRQKYDQTGVWLNVVQALPQIFSIRAASLVEICQRIRAEIVKKLRLQRLLLLEVTPEALLPLAPAGAGQPLTAEAYALLSAQASGLCNEPDASATPGVSALAEVLGLHRFMWSLVERKGRPPILMAAGFDRSKATFQSPFSSSDAAHFNTAARQIESLLGNSQLIAELEQESNQLREANLTLEQRDQALRYAAEQLRSANEGLELRVQERTQELATKNRDLRLVLDTVDQALLMIDLEGRLAPECSSAAERCFGRHREGASFVEHVATDERFAGMFSLGLDALREDILPREVALEQLPTRFERESRQFECRHLPIETAGRLLGLLLVIDDVTEQRLRAREDAEQRELLAAFKAIMRDRIGFATFFQESERMLESLAQNGIDDSSLTRILHTLKGNAGMFGLQRIAELCHQAETELAEETSCHETLQQLRQRWTAITQTLRSVTPTYKATEVSEQELAELAAEARQGASAEQIVTRLQRLRWEPAERVLNRLAEHAREIAVRLGKGALEVQVDADVLRFDPDRWARLWSSLVHVVRNAVDHGIESPDERRAAGKPPCGVLRFVARRSELGYRIEIQDDGRGIDWEAIRCGCERRGYPSATRPELLQALLTPGFSTRAGVTEVSGRGIGLAVVAEVVRDLSGRLSADSDAGKGTRWSFAFPRL
jgi:HPt (histidine-containing phosphotransfer) domain-containing protein